MHWGLIGISGNLYMYGNNEYFQCGFSMRNLSYINRINSKKKKAKIIDVKCGNTHTIIKTIFSNKYQYYSFGSNNYNQLLLNSNHRCCLLSLISLEYVQLLTKSNKNIIDLIPGYDTTYILQ